MFRPIRGETPQGGSSVYIIYIPPPSQKSRIISAMQFFFKKPFDNLLSFRVFYFSIINRRGIIMKDAMKSRVFRGFYIPKDVSAELEKYALLTGASFSSIIRMIVFRWLREQKARDG